MSAKKKLGLAVGFVLLLAGAVGVLKWSDVGTALVWKISASGTLLLPLVAVSALIDSVNPCAFSILLLTIAFLFSIGRLRSDVFKIGGAYLLGIFLAYLAIGLGILQALHFFNTPNFMGKLGAALLIVLGAIGIANVFVPAFPLKLHIPHAAHKKIAVLMEKSSVPSAFVLGGLVGLCEFPCTGGPYLMVLGLLHDQGTYLKGVGYLLLYNAIFLLPLAAILALAGNEAVLAKVDTWRKEHSRAMRVWSSIAMMLLGLLIFAL